MAANAALYDRWFAVADTDADGRITGPDAVVFFGRSGLPREILAKVWELANSNHQGFLDRSAFYRAMELVSMAQSGLPVSKDSYLEHAPSGLPPPRMAGLEQPGEGSIPGMQGGGQNGKAQQYQIHTEPSLPRNNRGKKPVPGRVCTSIIDGLKALYMHKIRPLEEQFKFGHFFSPLLNESDFEAKPSVLLLGQYSTGKTTFIKFILGREYPGAHIGPEPTTDRFVVAFHGLEERRIPGNTLAVQPDKPWQGLQSFGTGFLSRFEGSQCNAKLLEEITLVDTPGVLSGEKQRLERNYNFLEITEWFAARCDMILLLFDPYKLDISDEFKQVINCLRGHDDKVRVVLNKADQVDQQQLMRVYGALMWSLGKVFRSPEVCKVYIGSFNSNAPINTEKNPYGKSLFEAEQAELLADLYDIPQRSCDRKVNEFVKRVRAFKIHLCILRHMRKQMPSLFGVAAAQKKLYAELGDQFKQVQREYHLPPGDFPDVNRFRDILSAFDILSFPKATRDVIARVESVLTVDIPALMKAFDNPYA